MHYKNIHNKYICKKIILLECICKERGKEARDFSKFGNRIQQ